MNVFFDLEIEDYEYFHTERKQTEKEGMEEIRGFIEQRIAVLKDEIEREEAENKASYTVICIIPKDDWYGTVRFNYSENLMTKMKSCFSENDWEYLANKLERFL